MSARFTVKHSRGVRSLRQGVSSLRLARFSAVAGRWTPEDEASVAAAMVATQTLEDLYQQHARTIVRVVHDLNHAARYADHLIAMHEGSIVAQGHPREIVTAALVEQILGMRSQIILDPASETPMVIPIGRHASRGAQRMNGAAAEAT